MSSTSRACTVSEQLKWSPASLDQVKYDTQLPFIRQVAGPMDYTQGAMINAARRNYHPSNSEPMSQGTRCHQLGLYIVLDSPLNACATPRPTTSRRWRHGIHRRNPDRSGPTRILAGEIGEYIVTARRKGSTWYIGGITDWTPRDLKVDLRSLGGTRPASSSATA